MVSKRSQTFTSYNRASELFPIFITAYPVSRLSSILRSKIGDVWLGWPSWGCDRGFFYPTGGGAVRADCRLGLFLNYGRKKWARPYPTGGAAVWQTNSIPDRFLGRKRPFKASGWPSGRPKSGDGDQETSKICFLVQIPMFCFDCFETFNSSILAMKS
jgi:hypothetical protein